MSSRRLNGGLITLWLLFTGPAGIAMAQTSQAAPLEPVPQGPAAPITSAASPTTPSAATSGSFVGSPNATSAGLSDSTPAPRALPVNPADGSTTRKFYTLTASLRETYDSNVNTSNTNSQSSLETELSPSVLVDFPDANGDFSGRYTFGLTFYSHQANGGGNGSNGINNTSGQGSLQTTHELVAQYTHAFSDRFSVNAAESFRYFIEPSILQSTGTNYQNGPYYSNILNGTFTGQWTPLFSTTLTYSNTFIRYVDESVGNDQNSIENTGSATFGYALLPKITLNLGGIGDNIAYESSDRGYTTITAFAGATWLALPSLTVVGRGGASFVQSGQASGQPQSQSSTSIAPYAELTVSWSLGARSSLSFGYAHEVTPSDQVGANGEISDRINAGFTYAITPRITANLDGVFTAATTSGNLAGSNSSSYQENNYEVDTSLAYQYDTHFSFDGGIIYSGVQSNNSNNNYGRDEAYVGVRGTY